MSRVVVLLAFGLLAAPVAPAAAALVGNTPDPTTPETNGNVNAIVDAGDRVFLGGAFTRAGVATGPGADLSATDGSRAAAFAKPESFVAAVVPDGAGGWYVGGAFLRLGTVGRNRVGHLLADGSVDPAFDPNVDGEVTALALSGTKLYVAGQFTTVKDGVVRNGLAAFDRTTGAVDAAFDPNLAGGAPQALLLSGNTLYVGGSFETVGATARPRLAAVDATTGAIDAGFNADVTDGTVSSLALAGGTLYAGGSFTTVNGSVTRNRLAAFNATSGGVDSGFNPDVSTANSEVASVLVSGTTVYAGGDFTAVNGTVARAGIAAFSTTDGSVVAGFNPDPGAAGTPAVNALALAGTKLYLGGSFTTLHGGATSRNNLAAIDLTDGSVDPAFDPNLDGSVFQGALALAGSRIYAGGDFTFAGADTVQRGLAAVRPDGTIDAARSPDVLGNVFALTLSGDTLYAGLTPTPGGGSDALLAFDVDTGAPRTAFQPKIDFPASVNALVVDGGKLFAGGTFTTVNSGLPTQAIRNRLAAFDPVTGVVDPGFDPSLNANVTSLAVLGGKLYAGGPFVVTNCPPTGVCNALTEGVTVRNRLARFNETTGVADADFNPSASGQVNVLRFLGSRLYVGGQFVAFKCPSTGTCNTATAGVTVRNRLAAFDPETSDTPIATFDPNLQFTVFALALSGPTLYAGGSFARVNCTMPASCPAGTGVARGGLAAFDTTAAGTAPWGAGTVLPDFNPGASPLAALAVSGTRLYAGGSFMSVGGNTRLRFASFSEAPVAPTVVTAAASSITETGANVFGTVNPNGSPTSAVFEYGPSLSFGSITAVDSAGSGTSEKPVPAVLTGLAPHTTYYFRLVATNAAGTTFGAVQAFTTAGTATAPVAVTLPVASTGDTSAQLAGTVNPSGSPTAYTFEYGTSTAFGAITPVVALDDAFADEPVSASLSELTPDTTYYYRVVATNSVGTSMGIVRSFTTGPGGAPIVSTGAVSSLTATGATLSATVNPHGSPTAFAFEYGTSLAFGSLSAVDNADGTFGTQSVSLSIGGLAPGTFYLYRVVATNAAGTTAGTVQGFTTPEAAVRKR